MPEYAWNTVVYIANQKAGKFVVCFDLIRNNWLVGLKRGRNNHLRI